MSQVLSPGAVPDQPEPEVEKEEEWRENLNVRLICKDCREDPPNLHEDHSSGDLICNSCGLVLQERVIDQSSEWRTFSNDDQGSDDPSRVGDGPNTLLNGAQLNTGIAFGDGGIRGKELSRAQNKANLDKGNKSLLQAYKQIGALCDGWQLPSSVSDTAKHIYKDADESRLFKGKSPEALIAGCVFLACRRNGLPRSFHEVMALTKVSKKEIGRTFKLLENFLMKKEPKKDGQATTVAGGVTVNKDVYQGSPTANPSDLCARFCSMLNMNNFATAIAIKVAEMSTTVGTLAGRSPLSVAASCIYMASHMMNQPRSPKDIQQVAGVSDSTIRMAYRLLFTNKDLLITQDILDKGADPSKLPPPPN